MVKKTKLLKSYLWDTGGLFLYFADHIDAKTIMKEIDNNQAIGYVPQLVLVEFYYKTMEKFGRKIAEYQLTLLKDSRIKSIMFNENQVSAIGLLKFNNRNLSMVDCVIGELSRKYKAMIVTTDGDFDNLKGIKSINLEY